MYNIMSATCLNIIQDLNKSIDNANTALIYNMTEPTMKYEWVCIKPNISYDFYYQFLKEEWDQIINNFINQPNKCTSRLSEFVEIYRHATPERIAHARQLLNALAVDDTNLASSFNLDNINIDNIVLDVIANSIMSSNGEIQYELKPNFIEAMQDLGNVMYDNCQCQLVDIFKTIFKKYKKKLHYKYQGKTKDEVIELLRSDYNKFKQTLKTFNTNGTVSPKNNLTDKLANKLTGLYGFSIESELDRLIPKELGSLKQFFIRVISEYYNNLHPIVWAQIFKNMTENIFIDLPYTPDEIFSFASKYLLLNSGPFILKILQMIRPVLSPELATKYNLTKLTYPVLKLNQIDIILQKVVYNWDMYKVVRNFSASVGHVSKIVRVDQPDKPFMIKIIKPLAVAQSCWEYKTLYNVYPEGSCEQAFIKNMLESNGRELNVNNEINNINKGHEYYTATYNDVYGYDIDAKLTGIQNIPGIVVPGTWFALTMTLAPGIPLSKLVEIENNPLLTTDNAYRARLHRCLDILVNKFFLNIIKNGFYHGDLHAGNIFFSYEQNQMTLIDFGAVGEINIYADDPDIRTLLDIVVMSMFNNYDEMLDTMTELMNRKCVETQIDSSTPEYQELKQKLIGYKIDNILHQNIEKEKSEQYKKDIFSDERINAEKVAHAEVVHTHSFGQENIDSIYSYLEYNPQEEDFVIETRDELPPYTNVKPGTGVGFVNVLEEIIKFYALSGVNIAIKFNEFYEFQKAYALLLGVLHKVNYNSYRTGIAIGKAIKNWNNIPQLMHIATVSHFVKSYLNEKSKFKAFKEQMKIEPLQAESVVNPSTISKINETSKINKSSKTTGTTFVISNTNTINTTANKNISNSKYDLIKNAMIQNIALSEIQTDTENGDLVGGDKYFLKYLKYKAKLNKLMSV
ncbi:hypothetical protein QJ857_gp0145 [Tupanvirus soda lake]|uniref:ABC1 atypical kinase-like domain-containing protein n=2 Tax=Tupanvirus TaxID=2094720 RepID=A0A6N1NNF3_9VIRU|nr:hypothetical protein QJ857_gp0145 [Tupanvirus soda lake]QKU35879.1 hypothetical protein [Tupanvirus soda lake]